MKIFIDDLKKLDWLVAALPKNFIELPEQAYYVFYYNIAKYNQLFEIKETSVDYFINDAIYRKKFRAQAMLVGFLKPPFSSDNSILYFLLKSFLFDFYKDKNPQQYYDKLDDLFISYKIQDRKEAGDKPAANLIGSFEISNPSNLETALLHYITYEDSVQSCLKVAAMVHGYLHKKFSKSLYGSLLTKIVKAMDSPVGGLIPETIGSMRYMVAGEHSLMAKTDMRLAKAKELLRGGTDMKIIYADTGWWLNTLDGKWRTRMSDLGWFVDKTKLRRDADRGASYFSPEGKSVNDVFAAINSIDVGNPDIDDVAVSVGDILKHPQLFKYYPQLYNVRLLYIVVANDAKDANFNPQFFYEHTNNVFVYFCPESYDEDDVFLHEMQHAVQGIENFGNGGNMGFAEVISSVGGGDFRSFLHTIKYIQEKLCNRPTEQNYQLLASYVHELATQANYANPEIEKSLTDYDSFKGKCNIIMFPLLAGAFTNPATEFITKKYFSPFFRRNEVELISSAYEAGEKTMSNRSNLLNKGWKSEEIRGLYYNIYLGLLGEMEAREAQIMPVIREELAEYFMPLTSETMEQRFISVYNDDAPDRIRAVAGIELTPEGKYIIHLRSTSTTESFLHELGHLLYDHIGDDAQMVVSRLFSEADDDSTDVEEFFIKAWLSWLRKNSGDEELSKQLSGHTYENKFIDTLFINMFFTEQNMDGYLRLLDAKIFLDKLKSEL